MPSVYLCTAPCVVPVMNSTDSQVFAQEQTFPQAPPCLGECSMSRSFSLTTVMAPALALCSTVGTVPQLFVGPHLTRAAQVSSREAHPTNIAFSPWAIASPSVTACVVVGSRGRTLTTAGSGRRWARRLSRTTSNLFSVTCPCRLVCYAVGSVPGPPRQNPHNVILPSVDGGLSWRQSSSRPPFGPSLVAAAVTCPDVRTCLISNTSTAPASAILRTRNGGKTWRRIGVPVGMGEVACPTRPVCYGINGLSGQSLRSTNGGTTWEVRTSISRDRTEILEVIVCSGANTCLVTDSYCCTEGSRGDAFLSQDGAHTWTLLHHWGHRPVCDAVCLDRYNG